MKRMVTFGLIAVCIGLAQNDEVAALGRLDRRTDMVAATVPLIRYAGKAKGAVKEQVDKLIAEGIGFSAAGNTSEARRRIYHTFALLGGAEWTPRTEYGASLLLRTNMRVMDPARRIVARIEQIYPVLYSPAGALRLRVMIHEAIPQNTAWRAGKPLRELGTFDGVSRDLIDEPFLFDADVSGLGDGPKLLTAELLDGDTSLKKLSISIQLVSGLDARGPEIERRLRNVNGHESAKFTVRAPFDLARAINLGRREFVGSDFAADMRRSAELLNELEAGRDPLVRKVGDHKRHYEFAEAGAIMPYRVYIPKAYKEGARLPLVVALHGWGGTEDTFLNGRDGMMQKLVEQHGFAVVTPLGYRPNGGWGLPIGWAKDLSSQRAYDLSEKDVLNVVKLVSEEYSTDPDRTFLMGHSMGGGGVWHLGQKYADKWAALAPIAGGFPTVNDYPFGRLKGLPVMVWHGAADATAPVGASRAMVAGMKAAGLDPVYEEPAGATHGSVVAMAMPRIFEFFAKHSRRRN